MKYYMFLSSHTFEEGDLTMDLMFENMDKLILSYINEPYLFGYWLYNH